jgi:hypothetical protein
MSHEDALHAGFQQRFWQALWAESPSESPAAASAWAALPGFALYRTTVRAGCVEALRANFPVVAELVGDDWFAAAALAFVAGAPPQDNRLLLYGVGFDRFLDHFGPAQALPYLSGVARLDRAWVEALAAADAPALDAAGLTALAPDALVACRLAPHPAARWHAWDTLPVAEIWQAHREHRFDGEALAWTGGGLLITRPRDAVQWRPLPLAGADFLDACAAGETLGDAARAALTRQPTLDLAALLAQLLAAGAFHARQEDLP